MSRWFLLCFAFLVGCVHVRGKTAADGRVFFEPPQQGSQRSGNGISLLAEPEFYAQSEDEVHTGTVRPFVRVDPHDVERTHYDLRQADYRFRRRGAEFGAGVGLFDWGVMENHRAVDVINQKDLVEDIDGSEKLGQPYVEAGYAGKRWRLSWFYLPYFRDRTFPGARGRLRFPAVIDTEQPVFESSLGRLHPNFAARFSFTAGKFDVGISGFSGTSREPRFFAQLSDSKVLPAYDFLEQVSTDVQWTHGAFVAKGEALARWWSSTLRLSGAASGGAEYWFFDLGGKGVDLTLLSEVYWDFRKPDAPITFYDNDVFAGLRLGFSDTGGTEVLAGGMMDVYTGASFLRAEASRRFGTHWRLFLEARGFLSPPGILEASLRHDSYGQLRVAYFF